MDITVDVGKRPDILEGCFDDIDIKVKMWEIDHENQIKSLEESVETGKIRLAALESQKFEAEYNTESQLATVTKQSMLLNSVFDVFKNMSVRELEAKYDWESQWQERFSDIRLQHIEMQSALKIRHEGELKSLNEGIRDEMTSIVAKFQGFAGSPSPQMLKQLHKQNLKRLVSLVHKHASERTLLLSKIIQQEEMMIRTKNKSIRDKMLLSQVKSQNFHSSLKSSISKPVASYKSKSDISESRTPSFRMHYKTVSRIEDTENKESLQFSEPQWLQNTSSTFVTELDSQSFPKQGILSSDFEKRMDQGQLSISQTGDDKSIQVKHVLRLKGVHDNNSNKTNDEDMSSMKQKQSTEFRYYIESDVNEERIPGKEFLPWAMAAPETILKGESKVEWSVYPCKWNPNVISIERSGVIKQSATSPYASFTVDGSLSGRTSGVVRGSVRARLQVRQKLQGRSSTSASLTSKGSGARTFNSLLSQPTAAKLNAEYTKVKDTLPNIVRSAKDKQQSTDQNFNRPKLTCGGGTDSLNPADKHSKLETWIEDKIKQVLGSGSSAEAIRELLPDVNGTGLHHRLSGGAEDSHSPVSAETSNPRSTAASAGAAAAGYMQIESREHRSVNSRGQTYSLQNEVHETETNNVGSFLKRLRSEMDEDAGNETESANAANRGLRVESRAAAGRSASSLTASQISELLNPRPVVTKQVPQTDSGGDDLDDYTGGEDESAELAQRRARFDKVSGADTTRSKDVGVGMVKTPKRVGWNLSPRNSEPDNSSEMATDTLRLSTSGDYDPSRPGTRSSSRPDTSRSTAASSVLGDDEDERTEEANREESAGGIGLAITDSLVKEFFSKVRHNKVAECEDQISAGFPMDVRDRHGNTPLLVAAQNGHKRLVKMFLRAGADVNATNHQGNTGLHFTMSYGYQSLANYMLSKGADDTLMNMKGLTCYDGLG